MTQPGAQPREVLRIPVFRDFWIATTISGFSASVTVIALQVLVVTTLDATAFEVGIINALQYLPYLLFGLVAGALLDRWPRRPVLVWTSVARCGVLVAIPILHVSGHLTFWMVAVLLFAFSTLTLFAIAGAQSILSLLVPRSSLLSANARIDQSATVAQTSGPVAGGALVGILGGPVAVLLDAFSYALTAVLLARMSVVEAVRPRTSLKRLLPDVADGVRWTYRHKMLAPFAYSTHAWFLANSIAMVAFVPFALRSLDLTPFTYGLTLALAGVGGLVGTSLATPAGMRIGAGISVFAGRAVMVPAWAVIAMAPPADNVGTLATVLIVGVAQALIGFGMGLENSNGLGYRQAVTPDEYQGRMNATMRSLNRSMAVGGALAGGVLATEIGFRQTIWVGVAIFVIAALIVWVSPFRHARHGEGDQ